MRNLRYEVKRTNHIQKLESGLTMTNRVWAVYDNRDKKFIPDTEDSEYEQVCDYKNELNADAEQAPNHGDLYAY